MCGVCVAGDEEGHNRLCSVRVCKRFGSRSRHRLWGLLCMVMRVYSAEVLYG